VRNPDRHKLIEFIKNMLGPWDGIIGDRGRCLLVDFCEKGNDCCYNDDGLPLCFHRARCSIMYCGGSGQLKNLLHKIEGNDYFLSPSMIRHRGECRTRLYEEEEDRS